MAAPVITSNGGGDTATVFIAENNLTAGGVITATSDAGGFSISISGGDDAGQFQMNPMKGFLLYHGAVVFDFEHPTDTDHNNSYIVTVRAQNADGFDEQTITIIVTDVAPLIVGDGGNNTLSTTPENDTINGVGGDDTAVFTGNLVNYSLQDLGSKILVSGPDEHDTLLSIEHLGFGDGTIDVNDGSTVFDTVFYDRSYLDVFHAGVNALNHYNTSGWHEGRDPNAFFSTNFYLASNFDVRKSGVNPLDQYHSTGWREGRDPSPNFDTKLYLLNNPDVAAAGIDPLEHYLQHGMAEGRAAYAAIGSVVNGFDAEYYVLHNPDVAAAGVDPLAHFNSSGWREGRNPNALFDTAGYLAAYPDVAAAGINPLAHYETSGWREGRDPSLAFDTRGYLAANPDVAAAGINPLDHYLTNGIYEGRSIVSNGVWGTSISSLSASGGSASGAVLVLANAALFSSATLTNMGVQILAGDDFAASTATTGSVAVGGSASGNIETAGDADWFAVSLVSGTTYRFDLGGSGTAQGTLFSPQLELRDSGGNLLLTDTNSGGVSDDGSTSRLTYTATATGTFYLASDPAGSATGTYTVSATSLGPIADDFAASISTTGSVAVGSFATGSIETTADADWFAVSLVSGTTYQFDLGGSDAGQGTLEFPQLELRDGSGNLLLSDTTGGGVGESGWSSRITYTAASTGTFYLASDPAGNGIGTYRITATDTASSSNHPPVITSNGGGGNVGLAVPENSFTVTTVTATDIDPGTAFTYSLSGGADVARFQIDSETGVLSFITAPDFENSTDADHNNSYIVQVRVSDGALTDDQVITVNVANVREPANDFNGDGKADMLFQQDNGTLAVWLMDGTAPTVLAQVSPNPGPTWHAKGSGDFDGNGKSEVLWQNDSGQPAIWTMNGTGFAGGALLLNPGPTWHIQEAADFNNDGKADILWQHDNGTPAIWLMDGPAMTSAALLVNPSPSWHVKAAADFNNDGKADILWQHDNGTPAIWLMDGLTLASAAQLFNPGPSWHAKAAADFNADGKADILWQNDNGTPAIWLMDGLAMSSAALLANPSPSWHAVEALDMSGDGRADIQWQNDDGTPAVWLMDGFTMTDAALLPNPSPAWHLI